MAELTLQEARRILADCDTSDPARAIAAVAMVLRFEGIADEKLLPIAGQLESVADGLRTAGVPVVDEAQERIAFEAWCESRGRGHSTVLKFDNGGYRNETAREEWRGWLGRATHSSGVARTEPPSKKAE